MMLNDGFIDTLLGFVPQDWEMVPLGEVFKSVNFKLENYEDKNQEIPILSMTRSEGLILQSHKFDKRVASRDTSNYKIVKQGQLVYGFPIDEGVIAILHRYPIGAVSPAYHVWEPIREVDLTFIDYMLKTPAMINAYQKYSSNVVERRRNLAPRDFVSIEIPLPPLPEQRAIAHVLSTVRRSIEATERVIAAARELKRSLMKYLFTYGPIPIDQAGQVVLKETEIGEMPEGWDVGDLGSNSLDIQYGLNNRAGPDGDYPILRMNNLADGRVEITDLKFVGLDKETFEKYQVIKGDVLFNRTNSLELVGKTAIFDLEGDFVFASYLVKVTTDRDKILPDFLNYLMNWENTQSRLKALATRGVSQTNISAGKLRLFDIPLSPLGAQSAITKYLITDDNKINFEMQRKTALEALFNSLLHHLMTGKVRVNRELR